MTGLPVHAQQNINEDAEALLEAVGLDAVALEWALVVNSIGADGLVRQSVFTSAWSVDSPRMLRAAAEWLETRR